MSSIIGSSDVDRWNPDRLTLDPSLIQHIKVTPSKRKVRMRDNIDGLFLRGPIPMSWINKAGELGVSALRVGLILWHLAGLKKSCTFLVSNLNLTRWNIDRHTKSRALLALSRAGLIAIESRGKRSPQVTIIVSPASPIGEEN
jgi:hypothetical protein